MRDALRSLNPTYRAMRNGFRGWLYGVEVAAARLAKLQTKGRRILMQPQVKALNTWRAQAITYRKMLGIVHRMMSRQKSRAFEAWQALAEELRANGERMRGIMHAMSPEGRKKRAALNKLIAVFEQHRLMLRAGAALFYSKVKKALNNWAFVIEQTYRMQEGLGHPNPNPDPNPNPTPGPNRMQKSLGHPHLNPRPNPNAIPAGERACAHEREAAARLQQLAAGAAPPDEEGARTNDQRPAGQGLRELGRGLRRHAARTPRALAPGQPRAEQGPALVARVPRAARRDAARDERHAQQRAAQGLQRLARLDRG